MKDADQTSRVFFETSVLKAIYEWETKKSSETASDRQLKQYVYKYVAFDMPSHFMSSPIVPFQRPPARPAGSRPAASPVATRSAAVGQLADQLADTSISSESPEASRSRTQSQPKPEKSSAPDYDGATVLSEQADLLWFDYAEDAFAEQAKVDIKIVLSPKGQFNCKLPAPSKRSPQLILVGPDFLVAEESGEQKWLVHELNSGLNSKWSKVRSRYSPLRLKRLPFVVRVSFLTGGITSPTTLRTFRRGVSASTMPSPTSGSRRKSHNVCGRRTTKSAGIKPRFVSPIRLYLLP